MGCVHRCVFNDAGRVVASTFIFKCLSVMAILDSHGAT